MPKFNATVEFGLTTEIEVDLPSYAIDGTDAEGVGEYEDQSYFSTQTVDADGGSLSFEIEAEDEDAARSVIEGFVREGSEVEDSNGVTWGVENVSIDLDEIEEEMTKDKAIGLVSEFLRNSDIPEDVKEAIRFLILSL